MKLEIRSIAAAVLLTAVSALAQNKAPALRQKFADEKNQKLGDSDQDRDRDTQTARHKQSVGPGFGLPNRESDQARGNHEIDNPRHEIASHRRGIFIDRCAQSEER